MQHFGHAQFTSRSAVRGPQKLAFLLLSDFTHLAFACAIEPLRLANLASGRSLFVWRPLSFNGRSVRSSSGIRVDVDGAFDELEKGEILVIVGGHMTRPTETNLIIPMLRREHAHGREMMALCGGVTMIAEAGLAEGMTCATHWQIAPAFHERFPKVNTSLAAFELGRIPTASGGMAAADLQLALLRKTHGNTLARNVADLMVHHAIREETAPQTASLMYHIPGRNRKLASIVRSMETNIDSPLSAEDLADAACVSVRQMERLFGRYVGTSPMRHYLALRLNRAKDLIVQTDMSITEVAMATGFSSVSHFSRCFKAQFGASPHARRDIGVPGS